MKKLKVHTVTEEYKRTRLAFYWLNLFAALTTFSGGFLYQSTLHNWNAKKAKSLRCPSCVSELDTPDTILDIF